MDEPIERPEKRYMSNSTLFDELGDASEFDAFLREEKQKPNNESMEIKQNTSETYLDCNEEDSSHARKTISNGNDQVKL